MKNPSPYLKMRVLGAIEYSEGRTIAERIRKVSETTFTDEDGNPRIFTWRTIQTWLYRYKSQGVTTLEKKDRSDKGKTRKMKVEDLQEAINQILPHFRQGRYNKTDVYRKGIELGVIKREQLAPTSYYRFIRDYELLNTDTESNKRRMAFCMQYVNQLWQADTMFGPHVRNFKGIPIPTKLIAFIDDASRLICHAEFFFNENIEAMAKTIRSAFYKRGIPEQLYVDNGAIYSSKEITLICARVGCILRHTPVRDGAAKGKIERFFRTVRDQFLLRTLDLTTLDSLNKQFTRWVEDEYNNNKHSALGMTPLDRFAMDMKRINFLPPNQDTDELFYAEDTRKVKKDNTFSFNSVRWEPTCDLRNKEITIRFDREAKNRTVVYYKNHRIGDARLLDMIANGKLKRTTVKGVNP
jgi:transposase InsO family protein